MKIDEDGLYRISGTKESDHNTILLKLEMKNGKVITEKKEIMRLNAPPEKWKRYEENLKEVREKYETLLWEPTINISEKYQKWVQQIDEMARRNIGTIKIKEKMGIRTSAKLCEL